MGHVRLGKLPASWKWREVVALLGDKEASIPCLANSVERAADRSLADAVNDPGFVEALWLLLKIPQAAKSTDFSSELSQLGIRVPLKPTLADLLAAFDLALDKATRRSYRAITDFSVLAKYAAMSALQSAVHDRLPTLWLATAEDERVTLAKLVTTQCFGELAQLFFTHLLRRHLHYYLDREIPRHIGPGRIVPSIPDIQYFDEAVHRHCRETTFIIRAFAREWLGKNQFHLGKEITREEVCQFASYACTKIRAELAARGSQP